MSRDWETLYYEQQANFTESNGMLTQERNRAIERAEEAERKLADVTRALEAAGINVAPGDLAGAVLALVDLRDLHARKLADAIRERELERGSLAGERHRHMERVTNLESEREERAQALQAAYRELDRLTLRERELERERDDLAAELRAAFLNAQGNEEYAEELRADAERYHYLRNHRTVSLDVMFHGSGCYAHSREELDDVIDAFRAALAKGETT